MKRFNSDDVFSVCIIVALVISVLAFFNVGVFKEETPTRTQVAKIIYINDECITATTKDGNEWEFIGNGFSEGEVIELVFDTKETRDVRDDVVINVQPHND